MKIDKIVEDSKCVEKILTGYLKYLYKTQEDIRWSPPNLTQLEYRSATLNNLLMQITTIETLLKILHIYNVELLETNENH